MSTKTFITDNFLLENKYAEELYHSYAKDQPIIDYHNHLPPAQIAADTQFENISKVWLAGDHYKWRAMRTLGINEKFITGDASDKEKFEAWGKTVPHTLRNPLYHWTHLELKRYFGIEELLNEKNASSIYENVNAQLQQKENSCRGLLNKMNVETLCTTEDPTDNLKHHQTIKEQNIGVKVSTAFRPDKSILIDADGYTDYLKELGKVAEIDIQSFQDLKDALLKRIQYFDENGCKLCDHGLNSMSYEEFTEAEVNAVFKSKLAGKEISFGDIEKFKTAILLFLGETYHQYGWVQQFHLGALRNNNKRMLAQLGPDTGWDSIGDYNQAEKLSKFLDTLDGKDKLTKTILYNLNPSDNEIFATMIGNFNDGSVKGKVQLGSGWWFLDQKDGMERQMNALSNMGLISCFIGMLTDSRSFLSFPRHEYFRRVLCNLFGKEIASGELPEDMELVGKTISNICYGNANDYFNF
ncbi:glucuronate isomerase [Zunongwangia endophytica]|uniref:Uronate isomerase n=1 Tax=Zunongwangia endophytica TaxID=1808945 RepID=A0ABV8H6W0_9FLAO|nr:glucuronate isomerase [Zunongwangia endophytica]MDN3594900.1 glucuronate isomerase [Zunongwangia endophytica]